MQYKMCFQLSFCFNHILFILKPVQKLLLDAVRNHSHSCITQMHLVPHAQRHVHTRFSAAPLVLIREDYHTDMSSLITQ